MPSRAPQARQGRRRDSRRRPGARGWASSKPSAVSGLGGRLRRRNGGRRSRVNRELSVRTPEPGLEEHELPAFTTEPSPRHSPSFIGATKLLLISTVGSHTFVFAKAAMETSASTMATANPPWTLPKWFLNAGWGAKIRTTRPVSKSASSTMHGVKAAQSGFGCASSMRCSSEAFDMTGPGVLTSNVVRRRARWRWRWIEHSGRARVSLGCAVSAQISTRVRSERHAF